MKKILLLAYMFSDSLNKFSDHDIDYVFSLNENISTLQLNKLFGSGVTEKEEYFGKLLSSLFTEVREDYVDFVAEWGNKPISRSGENFKELFQWQGMSLWWISNLVRKDSETENKYFYRLLYLFFIHKLMHQGKFQILLYTDDEDIANAVKLNFPAIVVHYFPEKTIKKYGKWLQSIITSISRVVIHICQIAMFKRIIGHGDLDKIISSNHVFFASRFPLNWIKDDDSMIDRHFSTMPLCDHKFDKKTAYLIICNFPARQIFHFRKFREDLEELVSKANRPVIFLDSFVHLKDLLQIHCNWSNRYRFWKLKRSNKFKRSFRIKELDVGPVLIPELAKSFKGTFQSCQAYGVSFKRFMDFFENPQTIVMYAELLVYGRVTAHFVKKTNKANRLITIQHAMSCRNKMGWYHRKSEFSPNGHWDSIKYSPMPDNYLIQGEQYKRILIEFYPEKSIHVIGCVKYGFYSKALEGLGKLRKKCDSLLNIKQNEKIILLAPSVNDIDSIFHIINKLSLPKNYRLLLSPHPAVPISQMQKSQKDLGVTLDIEYITSLKTWEILSVSSLVVCGYSTVAIEAAIFGVQSVRASSHKNFPLFDNDPEIPKFSNAKSFGEWLNAWEPANVNNTKAFVERYFHRIDGQADTRCWEHITSLQNAT